MSHPGRLTNTSATPAQVGLCWGRVPQSQLGKGGGRNGVKDGEHEMSSKDQPRKNPTTPSTSALQGISAAHAGNNPFLVLPSPVLPVLLTKDGCRQTALALGWISRAWAAKRPGL
ncbi:hypothetical protein KIL84_000382 [Mauremys mutica]|uniref:Uncharacterized protein n=1 Tax=Mauremys mutica TaxID=74926 RepID=A0A9D3XG55_9SAUR|nr:hypothetical protein KIL84_000382 [Mauremys mutica]